MARTEPATLDNHGAQWTAAGTFEMAPTAERYEQYEISFAAKVPRTSRSLIAIDQATCADKSV